MLINNLDEFLREISNIRREMFIHRNASGVCSDFAEEQISIQSDKGLSSIKISFDPSKGIILEAA